MRSLLAGLLVLVTCAAARAELRPDQVFLVYNRNVAESRSLAEYYAQKRGVPIRQMLGLDLPDREEIPREAYLAKVRAPLRAWLTQDGLRGRVRCIVPVYGVPLRVGKAGALPAERPLVRQVNDELDAAARELDALADEMAKFTGEPALASQPASQPQVDKTLPRYEKLRDKALAQLRATTDQARARRMAPVVKQFLERGEGAIAVASMLQATDPAGLRAIESLRGQMKRDQDELRRWLHDCPRGPRRADAHARFRLLFGLRGLIDHLRQDQAELDGRETQASLDSELSLLWWDDYPLYRWVLNPACVRMANVTNIAEKTDPVQMAQPVVLVARLDAPTAEIVRRMIDDAIATEAGQLAGKVYIDARGMKGSANGYGQYDENLREMAQLLEGKTSLAVVLDDRSELFEPGDCPDAALYCGWYSLGKYVDAFRWSRGSVAYHIASSEAVSLRGGKAQYWCKRMLEEGVAATLGPVAEPYLSAFPLPRDFFGLLLTGRYTLVECYAMTSNFNSWMMTLLGDPLYNPYKTRPLLKAEDVFPAGWLPAPTASPATAPSAASAD